MLLNYGEARNNCRIYVERFAASSSKTLRRLYQRILETDSKFPRPKSGQGRYISLNVEDNILNIIDENPICSTRSIVRKVAVLNWT